MAWTSARSVSVGVPPALLQVNSGPGLLIGATAMRLPLKPPRLTAMTPAPGVAPTALLTASALAGSGQGPRSDAKAYLAGPAVLSDHGRWAPASWRLPPACYSLAEIRPVRMA
jgi:hypothetical protein